MLNIDIKTKELIDSPNAEEWRLVEEKKVPVLYVYHKDKPAVMRQELVAEYPNGGKDYREVVVEPEEGHFAVTNEDGSEFQYHIDIPEGISKDAPVPDIVDMVYWERYTKEEIAEREQAEAEAREKAEAREAMLEELPDTLASTDDAICMLYEMVLEGQNG